VCPQGRGWDRKHFEFRDGIIIHCFPDSYATGSLLSYVAEVGKPSGISGAFHDSFSVDDTSRLFMPRIHPIFFSSLHGRSNDARRLPRGHDQFPPKYRRPAVVREPKRVVPRPLFGLGAYDKRPEYRDTTL
jgi:hypothetical protein